MTDKLPDFFIVGAAKAGTTSLYKYLEQHPSIYLPNNKEPKYFVSTLLNFPQKGKGDDLTYELMVKDFHSYKSLFKDKKKDQICGEASVDYLYYSNKVIPLIKDKIKNPKIIIMLRNPVNRAFSAYNHLVRDVREHETFSVGLSLENKRIDDNYEFIWHYKTAGLYANNVKNYIDEFNNVKIIIFEDFIKDPLKYTKDVFRFLNVSDDVDIDIDKAYNSTGVPKNKELQKILKGSPNQLSRRLLKNALPQSTRFKIREWLENINLSNKKTAMDPQTRKNLSNFFKEDKSKLEKIIKMKLNHWE